MWARWLLASAVAIAAIVGIVIAFNRAGPDGATSEAGGEIEANRIADIAISEDQAPHFATLATGANVVVSLEHAIGADVRQRISDQQLTGPLSSVTCKLAGAARSGRRPYDCTVRSNSASFPFLAVVEEATGKLAWCKVDPSPVKGAGPEELLSASCRT